MGKQSRTKQTLRIRAQEARGSLIILDDVLDLDLSDTTWEDLLADSVKRNAERFPDIVVEGEGTIDTIKEIDSGTVKRHS